VRILAIRGRNLASLARTFAVELAHGDLANAGLFAITGPVGAGKSTLLDALCLALFDRTPRLSGRGGTLIGDEGQDRGDWLRANDPRTLLRRNAVDGYAEVDFVGRDGVTYRSRWSVRRARRKPDGRLQDQELVLRDLAKDTVVSGGRRTEVLAAIKHRLGLDFSQFCRSVLLAQGEFHAFLHAAADERAKLLETLTGAQLYRRLSQRAYRKKREHDIIVTNLRDRVEQCEVLTDDLRASLEQERTRLQEQIKICDVGIKLAQDYVIWHKAAAAHREEEDKATHALQAAVAASDAADGRRKQLLASQRAMAVVPRWEVVLQGRQKVVDVTALVGKATAACGTAEQRVATLQKALAERMAPHFGTLSTVPDLVRTLPQWRPSLERWQDNEEQAAAAAKQVAALGKKGATAEKRCAELRSDADRLEKAEVDAEAVVHKAEKAVSEADYDRVAEQRRELAAQEAELQRSALALQQWQAAGEAMASAEAAHAKAVDAAATAEPDRQAREAQQKTAAAALAEARKHLQKAEQQHGLAALRAQLADGEDCPLCGSTEHPAEVHDVADVEALRQTLAQCEEAYESAQKQTAQAELDWQRLQSDVKHRAAELQSSRERTDKAHAACALTDGVVVAAAVAELEQRHKAWQEADASLKAVEKDAARRSTELREARGVRRQAELHRTAWREQLQLAEQELRAATTDLGEANTAVARANAVMQETRQGLQPACAGLPDGVESIAALGEHRLAVLQEMHERHEEVVAAEQQLADQKQQVKAASERESHARAELKGFEEEFNKALKANEVCEDDVAIAHRLGADALRDEAKALQALVDEVARCRTELSLRARLRREHDGHDQPTLDADEALQALDDAQKDRARIEKMRFDVHGRVMLDDAARQRRAKLAPELDRASQEFDVWRALNDLIGSSGGDAFAVYAQGLTLDLLLLEANRRLEELARRYRLEKSKGAELDFVVVDLDMGGTRRSLHTLSGGETFLVSLALALALATLAAPRSRVETLFLDEGFGTLDAQNLEIALGALDSLQATGCQVGVISHVDGIAERIGAVVEVRPEGSGQSRVRARGI